MASEQHNFIVSAIARKIKLYGFRIIYLDGKYQDVETEKPDIPPKIRLIGNRRDSAIYGGGWQRGDNLLNRERGAGKGVRCWIIRSSGVSGL